MAKPNYPDLLRKVLAHEGGYVNHPKDPGGATNYGVTQARYDQYRKEKLLPTRSVKQITQAEVEAIYKTGYWDINRCDDLPSGLDYPVFDGGVNSGPARGAKWLQQALGVSADGKVGPETLQAAVMAANPWAVARRACEIRRSFLKGLKTFETFGRGWMNRVADVEAHSVALAMKATGASNDAVAEALEGLAPINDERASSNAQKSGTAAGGAAVGGVGTQADPGVLPFTPDASFYWFLAIAAVVLIGVSVVYWRNSKAERAVKEAYLAKAKELAGNPA